MMYEMRKRILKPTLLPTQVIFNLPHHIGMIWEEHSGEMDCSTAKCYGTDGIRQPHALITT